MDIKAAKAVMAEVTRIYRAGKDGEEVFRLLELSEQMAKEHAAAVEALKKEYADWQAKNEGIKDAIAKALGEAGEAVTKATDEAHAIKKEASLEAAAVKGEANDILARVTSETAQHNVALKEVKAGFAEACKELASLENQIEAAKKAMTNALKGL